MAAGIVVLRVKKMERDTYDDLYSRMQEAEEKITQLERKVNEQRITQLERKVKELEERFHDEEMEEMHSS